MAEVHVYRGNIPTEPDVNKLKAKFPEDTLKEGMLISYDEISKEIDTPVKSSRFITVTNAWRRYLENTCHIILKSLRGQGFNVLSESGKLNAAADKYKSATKMAARAVVITTRIDTKKLSSEERSTMTILQSRAGLLATNLAAKRTHELPEF